MQLTKIAVKKYNRDPRREISVSYHGKISIFKGFMDEVKSELANKYSPSQIIYAHFHMDENNELYLEFNHVGQEGLNVYDRKSNIYLYSRYIARDLVYEKYKIDKKDLVYFNPLQIVLDNRIIYRLEFKGSTTNPIP